MTTPNKSFWAKKNILLTGHTGFKGGWLSFWLKEMNANVIGIALPPETSQSFFSSVQIENTVLHYIHDIRDFDSIYSVFQKYQPEIVIHMAAQAFVRDSYENPLETYQTNVLGTVNILEASRKTPSVKVILNITSDKCYENQEWCWGYREIDRLGGYDPYSNSKACAELVTSAYRSSYFDRNSNIALASARAGNVFGGGDWAKDRLIPNIIESIFEQKELIIRFPNSTRPWQHVLEPLNGYLLLAEKMYESPQDFNEAWNFGPNEEDSLTVMEVLKSINFCLSENIDWKISATEHKHEAKNLKLDCSKTKFQLKWKPRWSLQESIKYTIDWYRAYYQKCDMRIITSNQIQEFIRTKHDKSKSN